MNEITNLTINDFIKATSEYHKQKDIRDVMNTLKNQTEVIPTWYLLRIKTNKYYTTFSSPESTQAIIDYLYWRSDEFNNDHHYLKYINCILEDY